MLTFLFKRTFLHDFRISGSGKTTTLSLGCGLDVPKMVMYCIMAKILEKLVWIDTVIKMYL